MTKRTEAAIALTQQWLSSEWNTGSPYGAYAVEEARTAIKALVDALEQPVHQEPTTMDCQHSWTEESRQNGWRSSCRLCGAMAFRQRAMNIKKSLSVAGWAVWTKCVSVCPKQSRKSWSKKMTAITNLIIVLAPIIVMGLAIVIKDGF